MGKMATQRDRLPERPLALLEVLVDHCPIGRQFEAIKDDEKLWRIGTLAWRGRRGVVTGMAKITNAHFLYLLQCL
jgi:hypothetical protein